MAYTDQERADLESQVRNHITYSLTSRAAATKIVRLFEDKHSPRERDKE